MHEISLCENIRTLLEEQSGAQKFRRVTRICLDLSAFSCVDPGALKFGFDVVMAGSLAEGALLEITEAPGDARCLNCHRTVKVMGRFDPCPQCGETALQARPGEGLKIRNIEVV